MSFSNHLKSIIFLLVLVFSSHTFAQSADRCLRGATDDELLNEISRRLDGGQTAPAERSIAGFSCYYGTLNISLINAASQERRRSTSISNGNLCEQFASTLSTNVRYIEQPTLIATCYYGTLNRFMLQPSGEIVEMSSQSTSSENACIQQANQINDSL